MKLLIYTDIHHGSGLRYGRIDENGMNSRLSATLEIEDFISKIIDEEKIDVVFFLGDLVERSIYSHINDMVRKRIGERLKKCPHFFMRGNHDRYFKGFEIYGDVFNPFEQTIREPRILWLQDFKIGFLPYSNGLIDEQVDILFVHRDIIGASVGPVKLEKGEKIEELSQLGKRVFCGHIHIPQFLSKNVICLGSVVPTDLSECDGIERGIYIYNTENGELVQFEPPVPKLAKCEIETNSYQDLLELIQKYEGNNLVLYVKGEREFLIEILKKKTRIEKEIKFENLIIIPQYIDKKDEQKDIVATVGSSVEERLRDFVLKSELKGLDSGKLIRIGFEVLHGIRAEEN